jgi:nucleoside-diphosphate-sugar epimerase
MRIVRFGAAGFLGSHLVGLLLGQDITRAKQILGWTPRVGRREGLAETIASIR